MRRNTLGRLLTIILLAYGKLLDSAVGFMGPVIGSISCIFDRSSSALSTYVINVLHARIHRWQQIFRRTDGVMLESDCVR